MNPLVNGIIARERMASLQQEADRWRLAHPRSGMPEPRHGPIARLLHGELR
jgi:hypothetical protein